MHHDSFFPNYYAYFSIISYRIYILEALQGHFILGGEGTERRGKEIISYFFPWLQLLRIRALPWVLESDHVSTESALYHLLCRSLGINCFFALLPTNLPCEVK